MPTVYVYDDQGVSRESLEQTRQTFHALGYLTQTLNARAVQEGQWRQDALLFVMPGGADRPYVRKLETKGTDVIRSYVEQGGRYLGLCAGSYFASKHILFDPHGPLEVEGERALAFFPGTTLGPVFGPYDYRSQKGARAAQIFSPNSRPLHVFFNGGGTFQHADDMPQVKTHAYYSAHRPAIIEIPIGKGKAMLSGVHIEYDPALLNAKDPDLKQLIPALQKDNDRRINLLKHLLHTLLMPSSKAHTV